MTQIENRTGTKPGIKKLVAALAKHYGAPKLPPAKGPFELIFWENACYLLPDERRAEVFSGLRKRVGLSPKAILAANKKTLLELATMGGMRPQVRVFRWTEIARITRDQFGGNLDKVLKLPYAQAKKALKRFPNIGDPGAEKILMFCGAGEGLPLEWNGVRVLTRVGFGREHVRNYSVTYRSVQEDLKPELPRRPDFLARAHLLLCHHEKEICRNNVPLCHSCPVSSLCTYPLKRMRLFMRSQSVLVK